MCNRLDIHRSDAQQVINAATGRQDAEQIEDEDGNKVAIDRH